jgi:hypothetical protein
MDDLRSVFLCSLTARLAPPREFGATPRGTRRFFPVTGGSFEGPRLRGDLLPEGGDWLVVRPDSDAEYVQDLEVRITLRTDDDALIYVRYGGVRCSHPEVQSRPLRGETVHPSEYYFRTRPVFETSVARYSWLNSIVAVGVGERLPPDRVRYSIFKILQEWSTPRPIQGGGEMEDTEEGRGSFLVAGGNGAPLLEPGPEAFDPERRSLG